MSIADKIIELAASQNIAESLDSYQKFKLGSRVILDLQVDEDSRIRWLTDAMKGLDLAKLIHEEKTVPWPGSASVKYPIIANGAITFASREMTQLIRGDKIVECATYGKDPNGEEQLRAHRVAGYMSWNLLVKNEQWEFDTDKLLHMLPVIGTCFRKTYWNPVTQQPVSELCHPEAVIINNNAKSLESARRVSHRISMYKNDIVERQRLGIYCECDIEALETGLNESEYDPESTFEDPVDSDKQYSIIEQHTYADLDEDGYAEPYIITVHEKSMTVLRIVARYQLKNVKFTDDNKKIKFIKADQYFTDFHFIPSPDGTFYSIGFGSLLYSHNKTVNDIFNQLLNAGELSNSNPGFIGSGCRIKAGEFKILPGRWNKLEGVGGMDLKNSIFPLPVSEPSNVLFQLLGLMIESGKELASVSDILAGNMPTQNSPATSVLALIKQGLTQYNACHKRVLKCFQREFKKIYLLLSRNLDINEYLKFTNDPAATPKDFDEDDLHVRPVADPNMSSDAIRLATAQTVAQMPTVDRQAATLMMLQAMNVPDAQIQQLLPKNPQPTPEAQKMAAETAKLQAEAKDITLNHLSKAAELELDKQRYNCESKKLSIDNADVDASIELKKAQTALAKAQAVAAVAGADLALKQDVRDTHIDAWEAALGIKGSEGGTDLGKAQNTKDKIVDDIQEDQNEQTINPAGSNGMEQPGSDQNSNGSNQASSGAPPQPDQQGQTSPTE